MPNANSNKIPDQVQDICLKSQLFDRTKDFCSIKTDEQLQSDDGVDLAVNTIHKREVRVNVVNFVTGNEITTRMGRYQAM